jgi:dolichol-phosphate mannosyltransferase
MAPAAPTVSVVVPTRNEADNIQPLWERLQAALGGTTFELCFVDDSDDGTLARIRDLERADPRVVCLARTGAERAGGLSTAVVAGLRMARGQFVCVMDADLQHRPEAIPGLLAEATAGADLVVASRYVTGGSAAGLSGGVRRLVSRGASLVARVLFPEARVTKDPLSGFFLCRRVLLDGVEFRPVGFKILLELLVLVPGLRVVDVPAAQEPREHGVSKASARQGVLYLGHLKSLVLDVPGSARLLKFGIVGLSGLAVFLPALWALSGPGKLNALAAFVPAFALSAAWNALLNWRWTFADLRRRGERAPRHYLDVALAVGLLMFGVYAALLAAGAHVLLAGAGGAVVAMLANGLVNRAAVQRRSSAWVTVALDQGVQASLAQLAVAVGPNRAFVLPPSGEALTGMPDAVFAHAVADRRPVLITEAPSYRAQRRSNIEATSRLVVPVVDAEADAVVAVVVCERVAPRGFDAGALETAMRAVSDLVPPLAAAARSAESQPGATPSTAGSPAR